MPNPLRVRGTCPKCKHVINTTAPAGKATWRGECPQESCSGNVIARRVKVDAQPAADEEPAEEPPPRGRQRRRPIRAGEYVRPAQEPEPKLPRAAGEYVRPAQEPEPKLPRAAPVDSTPVEPVAQPGPGEPGGPPRRERPARPRTSPYEGLY